MRELLYGGKSVIERLKANEEAKTLHTLVDDFCESHGQIPEDVIEEMLANSVAKFVHNEIEADRLPAEREIYPGPFGGQQHKISLVVMSPILLRDIIRELERQTVIMRPEIREVRCFDDKD
jgi:hypothetical protein